MSMFIGEALTGEGNEIAHIDLLIGSKTGPVGQAFANALARQSEGHTNLLAVLAPNVAVKPSTVLVTKVTIKGMKQAVQMFGPAQAAVAKAVADSVAEFWTLVRDLDKKGALPPDLFTLEIGVGSGTRAARWLDRFRALDEERGTSYYPRLRFLLGDYSMPTLDRALAAVSAHRDVVSVIRWTP